MHFILSSLPLQYGGPFKISYNIHKDNLSVNELLTICVQEEEKLKHDILVKVNMATHDKGSASKGTK